MIAATTGTREAKQRWRERRMSGSPERSEPDQQSGSARTRNCPLQATIEEPENSDGLASTSDGRPAEKKQEGSEQKKTRTSAHAKAFLEAVDEVFETGGNARTAGAAELMTIIKELAELHEPPAVKPTRRDLTETRQLGSHRFPARLRVATYNARSVYGREEAICQFMLKHEIALLAIQEPMLHANNMPKGFFKSILCKPDEVAGKRGLMWVIHPAWKNRVREELGLDEDSHSVQWVQVTLGQEEWYFANVYLPHPENRRRKAMRSDTKCEAKEAVACVLRGVQQVLHRNPRAHLIVLGDMNADPFTEKGSNVKWLRGLVSGEEGLRVLQRPSDDAATRPTSSSHVDNIVMSQRTLEKVRGHLKYFSGNDVHDSLSPRIPSDHVPLMVELACRISSGRQRSKETQWNTLGLKDNIDHPYCGTLEKLVQRWLEWAKKICTRHLELNTRLGLETVTSLYQGLLLMMRAAAHQTLGRRRVPVQRGTKFRATDPLTRTSTAEMWKSVRQKLVSKGDTSQPPIALLEAELRAQSAREPQPTHRSTARWVRRQNRELDDFTVEETTVEALLQEAEGLIPVAVHLREKTRWNVRGGLDDIPPDMVKRAPNLFFFALAFVACVGRHARKHPLWLVLALAKWVPKAAAKWRGIRMGSLIAKPLEQLVTNPIFPVMGESSKLIGVEHMAGKRGLSADVAATTLACAVDEIRESKLGAYLVFGDVKHAFDNTWKEALWAKLKAKHPCIKDVQNIKAVYARFACKVKEGGYLSSLIEQMSGVPQGGPRSGDMFCFFTSDLSPDLEAAGAGLLVYDYLVVCIIFMDDFVAPCRSPVEVRSTLKALWKYGEKWDVAWEVSKFRVLAINVRNPQATWLFGPNEVVRTEQTEKYLSVHFDSTGSWKLHYTKKLAASHITRNELNRAGLLGGANVPAASLHVVEAILWTKLDYGRAATNLSSHGYAATKERLEAFTISTLRMAIGASSLSAKDGVIGESGALTDEQRSWLATLMMIVRMINAPKDSAAHVIIRRCLTKPRRSIGLRGEQILRTMNLEAERMEILWSPYAKARVKVEMRRFAEKEWQTRVSSSSRLAFSYPQNTALKRRGYLNENFRGRRLLTLLRIDDLPLASASWLAFTTGPKECWCGEGNETREHFLLTCPSLQDTREAHMDRIPVLRGDVNRSTAMTFLLLGSEPGDADNLDRAIEIGALVSDLWHSRGKRSGKHQETFFP